MATIVKMGRRKLGRVKCNITLPAELAKKADELSTSEGRALSHLIEEKIEPYVNKHWTPEMQRVEPAKAKPKAK